MNIEALVGAAVVFVFFFALQWASIGTFRLVRYLVLHNNSDYTPYRKSPISRTVFWLILVTYMTASIIGADLMVKTIL